VKNADSIVASKFALGADQTWLNNSANTFTVSGTITNSNNTIARTLTVDGSGMTALNGVIKDNGTGTVAVVKTGRAPLIWVWLTRFRATPFLAGITWTKHCVTWTFVFQCSLRVLGISRRHPDLFWKEQPN